MTSQVRDNPERGRFELDIGGQTVFARYARHGSLLVIPYVEASPALRGTGAASQLMTGVMAIARAEGLKGEAALQLCVSVDPATQQVPRPAWLRVIARRAIEFSRSASA